jgi:beta-glucosidase
LKKEAKCPIIVVLTGGSAMNIEEIRPYADAIIIAWYPGEQGGNALADIVFGKVSPAGRLPVTFYNSINDLPAYSDYNMAGKTYRYFKGKAQYPFGFGLSYTSFNYAWKNKPAKSYNKPTGNLKLSLDVENAGAMDGDEVVQVYVKYPSLERMPLKELKGFKRVSIAKGSKREINFEIPFQELMKWDLKTNQFKLYKGEYQLFVGGSSEDEKILASFSVK